MTRRKNKVCVGCGDPFITFKNYDYCKNCELNGSRYINKKNQCSECDGSGMIKFPRTKPRPCKLCHLTKPNMNQRNQKLTTEQSETQFWDQVEKQSKSLITNLLEKVLPISATPQVFDLERDTDYRVLLRDDLPNYYAEQEDYQAKIANDNWTSADVEEVAQDLTCTYFDLVVQALVAGLSKYSAFANTNLAQQFMN